MTPPQDRETLIAGLVDLRDEIDRALDGRREGPRQADVGKRDIKLLDACLARLRAERTPLNEAAVAEWLKANGYEPMTESCRHQKRAERTPPEPPADCGCGSDDCPQKHGITLHPRESSPSPARQGERTQDLVGAVRLIAQKVGVCQLYGPADSAKDGQSIRRCASLTS